MTEPNILQILNELNATRSRNDKEAILRKHQDNKLLKVVFQLALSPFVRFYVKKYPAYFTTQPTLTLWESFENLERLQNRSVTGNAAVDLVHNTLSSLSEDDAQVLERIIAKDLRCGVSEGTANKIWPGLIPSYPCMLASPLDEKNIKKMKWPAIAQMKMDAMRFNAIVNGDEVTLRTRNGKELLIDFDELKQAFVQCAKNIGMKSVVFDGELLIRGDAEGLYMNRQTGNGILNTALQGTMTPEDAKLVRAVIWDVIPFQHFLEGFCPVGYGDRFGTVQVAVLNLFERNHLIRPVTSQVVNTLEEAQDLFLKLHSEGHEGIILKHMYEPWENKRVKHQIKFKGEYDCDLVVVGVQEGTGKYKGQLGALLCESSDGVVKVSVGSGFSDEQRKKGFPIGAIVAVQYNQRIKDVDGNDSLFLPVFLEQRLDKSVADKSDDIVYG